MTINIFIVNIYCLIYCYYIVSSINVVTFIMAFQVAEYEKYKIDLIKLWLNEITNDANLLEYLLYQNICNYRIKNLLLIFEKYKYMIERYKIRKCI